jgi:hypothetical protein
MDGMKSVIAATTIAVAAQFGRCRARPRQIRAAG